MKKKQVVTASTFIILSALAIWGGSNSNSIPLKDWTNCGCAYDQCGCLQITLPPFGYTPFKVTPLVTTSNGTFVIPVTYTVPPVISTPTSAATLPVEPSITPLPTSNAGQLTAQAPTSTPFVDKSILTSIAMTSQAGKATVDLTVFPSTGTPIPTATPQNTNTPNPLHTSTFTPIPQPTQTPIPNAYYFNEANTWVDFWPEAGTVTLKRYDIINGISGHIERKSEPGDFPNSKLIKYQYGQDVALQAGQTFECERWTKGWNGLTEAIVYHSMGSNDCRQSASKFSNPANIPTGTGVNYPIWNLDQAYAQNLSYDSQGREEYVTMIPLNKSIAWMNNVLSPIHTAPKMLADCLLKGVRCMTMLQIYRFHDHVGLEEVIYISGMPYGGNNPNTQSFKDYFRNGELAWASYRVLGPSSNFPHPSLGQAYVDAVVAVADPILFQGQYYIYDGEYNIDGVEYDDTVFSSENRIQSCSFSNVNTWGFASGNTLANYEYNASLIPSASCVGTHQFLCIYNDQYMTINAQLWYKKHSDSVNDIFCTRVNSGLIQCDANIVSQGLVHFSTYYNLPVNANYTPNKPLFVSMDGPVSCDPSGLNPPLTPPATYTPIAITPTPVPTNTPVIIPTSIPGVFCSVEPDNLSQPFFQPNISLYYNKYKHPQCDNPHAPTKVCIDWRFHRDNNLPYLRIYQVDYVHSVPNTPSVLEYCNVLNDYQVECQFGNRNMSYPQIGYVEMLFRGDPMYPNGSPANSYFFLPNEILKEGACSQ